MGEEQMDREETDLSSKEKCIAKKETSRQRNKLKMMLTLKKPVETKNSLNSQET